jgi:fructose/tagatose bisphosphate aldolase
MYQHRVWFYLESKGLNVELGVVVESEHDEVSEGYDRQQIIEEAEEILKSTKAVNTDLLNRDLTEVYPMEA